MPPFSATCDNEFRVIEPQINAEGTHVHPFDPSFPIDVRYFTLRGGHSVRMNRHHYFELYFVMSGRTTVRVRDRYFLAGQGDLVVIGSDLYHNRVDPPDSQSRIMALFFEPELIRATDGTGEDMEYLMPFLGQKPDFSHVISARSGLPGEVLSLMQRIDKEVPASTARARLTVKTYLKMILILLVNHFSDYLGTQEDMNRKRADLERLRPLFEYLEHHYAEPIQVEDAARLCAMCNSYFMYFFRRTTGQPFRSYVSQFRIAKAQVLLTTTDKSLAAISNEVAFCNQSYFGEVFRRLVGVTPLAFRRQLGKGEAAGPLPMSALPAPATALMEVRGRNLPPEGFDPAMASTQRVR